MKNLHINNGQSNHINVDSRLVILLLEKIESKLVAAEFEDAIVLSVFIFVYAA